MVGRTDIVLEHVRQLFSTDGKTTPEDKSESDKSGVDLVAKYDGERIIGLRKPSYTRIADKQISLTDPDAAHMRQSGGGRMVLGYRDHYVVDGGKARIILSALVAPASIMDNTPMLDMVHWACAKWILIPKTVTGDAKYGTAPNITGLERTGMKAFVPIPDLSKRSKYYQADLFSYNAEKNRYICPQGQILKLYAPRKSEYVHVYRDDARVCNCCPVKQKCKRARVVATYSVLSFRSMLTELGHITTLSNISRPCEREVFGSEPLFGEAKQFHRLRRFRLGRMRKVNIEGLMVAAGNNLKKTSHI